MDEIKAVKIILRDNGNGREKVLGYYYDLPMKDIDSLVSDANDILNGDYDTNAIDTLFDTLARSGLVHLYDTEVKAFVAHMRSSKYNSMSIKATPVFVEMNPHSIAIAPIDKTFEVNAKIDYVGNLLMISLDKPINVYIGQRLCPHIDNIIIELHDTHQLIKLLHQGDLTVLIEQDLIPIRISMSGNNVKINPYS